jgi:hypothetical protein
VPGSFAGGAPTPHGRLAHSSLSPRSSVVSPLIVGAYSLHFGRGNPLNCTASLLPDDALYPSCGAAAAAADDAEAPPSLGRVARRLELLAAVEALLALRERYGSRGGARAVCCAHVYTASTYVAHAWAEWLPRWEAHGWPGEAGGGKQEQERRIMPAAPPLSGTRDRRSSTLSAHGSIRSRSYSRGTSSRISTIDVDGAGGGGGDAQSILSSASLSCSAAHLFDAASGAPLDADLLRQLAKLRAHFGTLQSEQRGGCFFYAAPRRASPAYENARAAAAARGEEALQQQQQQMGQRRTPSRSAARAQSRTSLHGGERRSSKVQRTAPTLPPLMLDVPEAAAEEATQVPHQATPAAAGVTPSAEAPSSAAAATTSDDPARASASPPSTAADTASLYAADDDDDEEEAGDAAAAAAPAAVAAVAAAAAVAAPPASARSHRSAAGIGGGGGGGVGGARASRRIYTAPLASDAGAKRLSTYAAPGVAVAPSRRRSLLDAVHVEPKPPQQQQPQQRKDKPSTRYMPAMASDAYRRDANLPRDKRRMKWWERAGYWLAA